MSKSFEVIFKEFADSETFVLSRALLEDYKRQAAQAEQDRIIKLLTELNAIRRDALGHLVAFDTYGEKVIYLTGLETK